MAFRIYNTLSRETEEFTPQKPGEAKVYCCGPTVYWFQHIGNLRTYVNEDVFRRLLEHEGFRVRHVMNLTDVGHLTSDADEGEDKMDLAARREHKSPKEIADFYANAFFEDCELLRIKRPDVVCKATEHIPEMIELIKTLEKKGFTYRTSEGIFFDVSKFPKYSELAKLDLKGQKTAVREEVIEDKEKRNPYDFALWFYNKPNHLMQWDTPWGRGFPGWHIECSAMSLKYLGPTLDVHLGGIDHIPVHHTNEIAQSEAATGKKFCDYWMHNAHLSFGKEKISKSKGHTLRPKDLEKKGFSPLALRFMYLNTHYRSSLPFTEKLLDDSQKGLARLQNFVERLNGLVGKAGGEVLQETEKLIESAEKSFFAELESDLNAPKAIQALFDFVTKFNSLVDDGKVSGAEAALAQEFMKEADSVLAVLDFFAPAQELPPEAKNLVEERELLRNQKNFAEADKIRARLLEMGVQLLDTPQGVKWKIAKKQF